MGDWDQHCPNCFQIKKDEKQQCQFCGYDESKMKTSPAALPLRTILNGHYLVGRVLGSPGGFGITYLCWDIKLATLVAIREFMPLDIAMRNTDQCSVVARNGTDLEMLDHDLKVFLAKAQRIAGFDHPNIVRVKNYFEQYGTAYLVMDYYKGLSLAEYVAQKGGRLPEKTAVEIMRFVLDGLWYGHEKGFLHRDVKPQNIYLTTLGQVILLDFGQARYADREHCQIFSGEDFLPLEHYSNRGKCGAWTDIYAWGATLYFLVTGHAPTIAIARIEEDNLPAPKQLAPELSDRVNDVIMKALHIRASERPQSIEELKKILSGTSPPVPKPDPKPAPEPRPGPKPVPEPKPVPKPDPHAPTVPIWRRKEAIVLGICLLVLLALGFGYWDSSGVLVVTPYPEDSEVVVDGVYQGRGRLRLDKIIPGKRVVSVERQGYADYKQSVVVKSGEVQDITIRLAALQENVKTIPETVEVETAVMEAPPAVSHDFQPVAAGVSRRSPDKTENTPIHRSGDTYFVESVYLDNPKLNNTTERKIVSVDSETLVMTSTNIYSKRRTTRTLEFTHEWNLIRTRNADESGVDYSPPIKYFEFPLYSGKTWQQSSVEKNIKTGAKREHTLTGVVGGWESVTVLAGTFQGIKVTIESELLDYATGEKSTGTDVSWYVPELRRSVKSQTTSRNSQGIEERQQIQLIQYALK
jgi:serine/threonine protein kinase